MPRYRSLGRRLMEIDEQRVKAFLDVIAQLALEDAEREARGETEFSISWKQLARKAKYRIRIRGCE